jgi:hypothetical protein
MHKRDEIIEAIKKCAAKLGRAPSQAEFRRASKISWYQVYKHFRGMRQAVRAAGLEPGPRGGALDVNALTLDWAGVVRKLGRLPSRAEYSEHGIHHAGTLHARIVWSQMAHKFVLLVKEFHLEREWTDVVKIVVGKFPLLEASIQQSALSIQPRNAVEEETEEKVGRELTRMNANRGMRLGKVVGAALAIEILMAAQRSSQQSAVSIQPEESNWQLASNNWHEQNQDQNLEPQNLEPQRSQSSTEKMHALEVAHGAYAVGRAPCGRPVVYGEPLGLAAMAHAPTNELGVLFLFGIVAADLGFRVERLQAAFPD